MNADRRASLSRLIGLPARTAGVMQQIAEALETESKEITMSQT